VLDTEAVKPKWNEEKKLFFEDYIQKLQGIDGWHMATIEQEFKVLAAQKNIKPGELQLPMRVMLVGGKFGPAVMQIAELIGKDETISRIKTAITVLQ
jgi:glutamyl-tRNA synthetase